MSPVTQYVRSQGYHIAYLVGAGPPDVILIPGFRSHLEIGWEQPLYERWFRRVASYARLILIDKRGTGLSDKVPHDKLPTLEERMGDVLAVLDAVGSSRTALFGISEGGAMAALFAATYPARTSALILSGAWARAFRAHDYPWGFSEFRRAIDGVTAEEAARRFGPINPIAWITGHLAWHE
jgi:pimeloyl-ACP methyl ester carboxylesterase